jgi:signal transduction histidine kinase
MSVEDESLMINELKRSSRDGEKVERCLSNLVNIIKVSLQADISGAIVCDMDDVFIVCEGFTPKEKQQLLAISKHAKETLEERLQAWWPGNLICYSLKGPNVRLVFAGRRNKHRFGARQQELFASLTEFTNIAIESVTTQRHAESKILAEERNKIACEMHDGLAQTIYSMALQTKTCRRLLLTDLKEADAKLVKMEQLAAMQIEDIRGYMRALKDNRGISDDLPSIINKHTRRFCSLHGLEFDLNISGHEVPLSREINNNLYYVITEGVANIARHAQASKAKISIIYEEAEFVLKIEDDGRGVEISKLNKRRSGTGLDNIMNRIQQIGGTVTIQSRPEEGMRIIAYIPYEHVKHRSSAFDNGTDSR